MNEFYDPELGISHEKHQDRKPTETEHISKKSLLTMQLFETINKAHIKVADKLDWDMYINPNDVEWRLALATAIDEVLEKFGNDIPEKQR